MRLAFQAQSRSTVVSAALHGLFLAGLLVTAWRLPKIAEVKRPGTAHGTSLLSYYALGSPPHAASAVKPRIQIAKKDTIAAPPATEAQKGPTANQPGTTGSGNSQLSGLGDGDVSFALQKVFPPPHPDLSSLPHGTVGDVVLDAVIDENGKVAQLTLVKGLGPAIDQSVMATVQQWTYTPATRNGIAVASEQELHFHYERA